MANTLRQNERNTSQGPGNYVAHSLTSAGHDAGEDGTGRGTPLVASPLVSRSSRGHAQSNSPGHNADSVVAYPLARRGRDGGSELEVGEPGVYNALRAGDGGSSRLNQVMVDMAVRRLTPVECERLQGLPDGWTQLDAKTPDSRRYSALGDAVTANVAEWIGRRLA